MAAPSASRKLYAGLFLVYAAVEGPLLVQQLRRIASAKPAEPMIWSACRWLNAAGMLGVVLDNTRLFLGGFWSTSTAPKKADGDSATQNCPPLGAVEQICAALIYSLLPVHLILVPLLIISNVEICVSAVGDCPALLGVPLWLQSLRAAAYALAFVLAFMGAANARARFAATRASGGLRRKEMLGISMFSLASLEDAKKLGFVTMGSELWGVQAFAFGQVIAGAFAAYAGGRSGLSWPSGWTLLLLAMMALFGQATAGALFKRYFFLISNFWEIVAFLILYFGDRLFFDTSCFNEPSL
eukprot:gnl/TRDRNA2_/TRDRNA2_127451_c0_seq2.p1 gnl/TRDRNA2_/TRDRNA2_127451_c0~~gnl/TRDRNA2_/TRDRNA2_127451_c0_seq2.p1  ORF type:complete len:298 (-),score=36.38 gnl/TRDRNA2_/TRDRNA2_127451_c0_seq2:9-902(-)